MSSTQLIQADSTIYYNVQERLTQVSRTSLRFLGRDISKGCRIKLSKANWRNCRCWSQGRPCCTDGDIRGSCGHDSKLMLLSKGFSISVRKTQ